MSFSSISSNNYMKLFRKNNPTENAEDMRASINLALKNY